MSSEVVKALKQELRNWESEFVKNNGRKPTRADIQNDENVCQKYEDFTRYKKQLSEKPLQKTEVIESKTPNPGGVWGEGLLKKNCPKSANEKKAPLKKCENVMQTNKTSRSSWGSALRKNISKSPVKRSSISSYKQIKQNTVDSRDAVVKNGSENNENVNISPCNKNLSPVSNNENNVLLRNKSLFTTPIINKNFSVVKKNLKRNSFLNREIGTEDLGEFDNLPKFSKPVQNAEDEDDSFANRTNHFSIDDIKTKAAPTSHFSISNDKPKPKASDSPSDEFFCEKRDNVLETKELKMENFSKCFGPTQPDEKISYSDICLQDDRNNITENERLKSPTSKIDEINLPQDKGFVASAASVDFSSGTSRGDRLVSNNFVRVNMKKKVYKGQGSQGKFLKKQVLRRKMAAKGLSMRSGWKGRSGGRSYVGNGRPTNVGFRDIKKEKCFKCGEMGHWSSKCPNRFGKRKAEEPETKETLDEVLSAAGLDPTFDFASVPVIDQPNIKPVSISLAEPLSDLALDEPDHPAVVEALKMFGYESFRPGQYKAIARILRGDPTLLVLATGSGKSLCYQLPAYLYATHRQAITIVVSPLVSLMDDQVHGLPKMLKAVRLHSGMTKVQRSKVLEKLENGEVHVLLLSPEALTSWTGMSAAASPLSKLPPVAFVCVDECHCLSEWSHSFRPSYLRVCKVLIELGVKCMVGLTATATMDTCLTVAKQLGITDMKSGIVAKMGIPPNLILTASRDKYKDQALFHLLCGERFRRLDSIIVYCTRRDECARVSALLRAKMQSVPATVGHDEAEEETETKKEASGKSKKRSRKTGKGSNAKRRAVAFEADCYHAGMSTAERRKIQNRFMSGELRIVVATVAFGMGIDKHDVRSVIHYNTPRSFERYVQEIGRAGRDGKPAHCHLFQDANGGDLSELSRHSHAKSVDRYTIKQLIRMVFPPCTCNQSENWDDWGEELSTTKSDAPNNSSEQSDTPNNPSGQSGAPSKCSEQSNTPNKCSGHFVAIPIDEAVEKLDLAKEGIETLLCFLELEGLISVQLPTESRCRLDCYGGPRQMLAAAKKCPAVAMAIKMSEKRKDAKEWETEVNFCAAKVADKMGMQLGSLKKVLRLLEWDTTLSSGGSAVGKSGIAVDFTELSFCLRTKTTASDEFLDSVTQMLFQRSVAQERKEIAQLNMCFNTLQRFSYPNAGLCCDLEQSDRSDQLKQVIQEYFQTVHENNHEGQIVKLKPEEENEVKSAVRNFLFTHGRDVGGQITGRAIARIFQGIGSPRYPATNWGSVRTFWRSKLKYDFNAIMKLATEEIIGGR